MSLPPSGRRVASLAWRDGHAIETQRDVPEEVAVALSYNRESYAVMMATPDDLVDFATGFSLNEGTIADSAEIEELEIVAVPQGIELRMWLPEARMEAVTARRRRLAGVTGCGMCGLESLNDAMRPPKRVVGGARLGADDVRRAMAEIGSAQALNHRTHAVHAAAFWRPSSGLVALREDVGRHNALDKLTGALASAGVGAAEGIVLLTSRVSVELVQKAAAMGATMLAAISAPTALAIRVASEAGITVIGVARSDGFEVFTGPERVIMEQNLVA
jgi:FdhD protein